MIVNFRSSISRRPRSIAVRRSAPGDRRLVAGHSTDPEACPAPEFGDICGEAPVALRALAAGKPQLMADQACVGDPAVVLPPPSHERLDRLAPDQRAAPPRHRARFFASPPAGSGKTTTLVARSPARSRRCRSADHPVTFNKRAPMNCARVDAARWSRWVLPREASGSKTSTPWGGRSSPGGCAVEPLLDREAVLRDLWRHRPQLRPPARRRLQQAQARHRRHRGRGSHGPRPGPVARAFPRLQKRRSTTRPALTSTTWWLDRSDCSSSPFVPPRWVRVARTCSSTKNPGCRRSQLRLALLLAAERMSG